MRTIRNIVLHCTATSPEAKVQSIQRYWREKLGWKHPGYHFIIDAEGEITQLQDIAKPSNGVKGHNHDSIHISYIGGVDDCGKAKDTRTAAQYTAMTGLVKALHASFPDAEIKGHRDFEGVTKACPSFEVSKYLTQIKIR